jgi:hypothetical protein
MSEWIHNIRRNHALEHATVQLMIARLGPTFHLVGRAASDGFFIYGDIPSDVLTECAHEALSRLKSGESYWAITPLCGTNIVITGALSSLATIAVMKTARKGKWDKAMTASMLAVVVARPVGRWLQRFTTSPDLERTEIVTVEQRSQRFFKVVTRLAAASLVPYRPVGQTILEASTE